MGDFLRDPVTLWTIPRFLLVAWVKLRLPWPCCLVAVSRAGKTTWVGLTCNYCSVQWKYCLIYYLLTWFVLFVCLSCIKIYSMFFFTFPDTNLYYQTYFIWLNHETGLSPHAVRFLVQARGDAPLLSPTLDESLHLLGFRAHSQT